ncbi:helix-turn-helix domain-containing protein [Solitalea lacus]|uniref:helix-turn-helix domain-containing protein n=1 Tax=Solitalea lacus TaxID=2911172 RepID=UPI001EDB3FFD|nr:helix-turn-helix domain-containing protein [Solitalea lacus]UKJ06583.1 helix-turn-helix domain-containing protein [Solitalea lacus]
MFDSDNTIFKLAVQFVNQTNRHLFITGKAGTGKTTFLRYIHQHTPKKMVVVAPTGVAAINAGGVTIHSFFQLPFEPFLPINQPYWNKDLGRFNTIYSYLKGLKMSKDRKELIQEMDLLVIDEVSMVRADLLDTVDSLLRYVRQNPVPFGGVQVVFIGDLFQLPPVVKSDDWSVLRNYYKSPFFFDANVIQESEPLYLELTKIYRQQDDVFINLLNNIRSNTVTTADLECLHQYYKPEFKKPQHEDYITLTTHTVKADQINKAELEALPSKGHLFKADVTGDFNESAYPVDEVLELKEKAQIMFIKNDSGEHRRYYNGRLATVKGISAKTITVVFSDGNELELEKESWHNVKYQFNKDTEAIDEIVLGEFKQYPVRLAWAVTIHKSQGLTFEKAIVDAGASFAAGQVYVALSRLTNLQGLVLLSKITQQAISTDDRVIEFCSKALNDHLLEQELKANRKQYVNTLLLQTFNWNKLVFYIEQHYYSLNGGLVSDKTEAADLAEKWYKIVLSQQKVANTFILQLDKLLPLAQTDGYATLIDRIDKAVGYFSKSLDEVLDELDEHINQTRKKKRVTKYLATLKQLRKFLFRKVELVKAAQLIAQGLAQGVDSEQLLNELKLSTSTASAEGNSDEVGKSLKGETRRITLEMFKSGKAIAEIAVERNLTTGTVEGHLTSFISSGEIKIEELITEAKLEIILQCILKIGDKSLGALKEDLGDDFSYGEIKAALEYRKTVKNELRE